MDDDARRGPSCDQLLDGAAMITDKELETIRTMNLGEEVVRIALSSFVATHLRNIYKVAATPAQVREALEWFVQSAKIGGLLERARDVQAQME